MTKAEVRQVSKRLNEIIQKEFGGKYAIASPRGRYDHTSVKFTIEFREEIADFESNAPLYGLVASDYGKTFQHKGKTLTLVGFETSRSKFPICCRDKDGKETLFTRDILAKIERETLYRKTMADDLQKNKA